MATDEMELNGSCPFSGQTCRCCKAGRCRTLPCAQLIALARLQCRTYAQALRRNDPYLFDVRHCTSPSSSNLIAHTAVADGRTWAAACTGAPIPSADLEPFVDGVVRTAMTRDHIAGVTVSIVQDGQVVLKKGYGFAGPGRPVDPDRTLFRIGSISKTFTWIAAMKEVEAGRMRLDGPSTTIFRQIWRSPRCRGGGRWRFAT